MPRRITKAFFATAAAGATITTLGFAAASPAGAAIAGRHHHFTGTYFTPSGGTPIPTAANCVLTAPPIPANNCAMSGYQASGRTFRFAQALITVPNHNAVADPDSAANEPDPTLYVALDNSSTNSYEFARVGIAPCPSGATEFLTPDQATATTCPLVGAGNTSGWVTFSSVQQPFTAPTISLNPVPIAAEGAGILVNAYLEPTGNAVHFTTTLPGGTTFNNVVTVSGPVYTKAMAVADWTTAVLNGGGDDPPMPDVPVAKIRDSQFFQGRFTTSSGAQGTFNGPWTVTALEATSNGFLPPTGTLIGQPSFLWNDGSGFNKMGSDAFGVWRFPF
jgi:hypothetical protein